MAKTIVDIAKLAGVAKLTVSRYLNGGYVSNKTKKKIAGIYSRNEFLSKYICAKFKSENNKFNWRYYPPIRLLRYNKNTYWY